MNYFMKKDKQKGFTIIELLVGIGIIAVLVAAVYPLIQRVTESSVTKVVNDDLRLFDRMVIETRGPGGFNVAGLTLAEVVATDKSNKLRRDDGAGGFDVYVGDFLVTALTPATSLTANDSYEVTIDGFDDQQCSDVTRNLYKIYNSISVNGTTVKANSSDEIEGASSTAISTNCSELDTNGLTNVLAFTKRISG